MMRRLLIILLCLTLLVSVIPALAQAGSINDITGADDRLNTSASAINAAGLTGYYGGLGPFTVFWPSDNAFRALSTAQLQTLNSNPGLLAELMRYHSVLGVFSRDQLAAAGTLTSLQGGALTVTGNPAGRLVLNGVANIIAGPIQASNGVIYIIDKVLEIQPPAAPAAAAPADDSTAITDLNDRVVIVNGSVIYVDPFTHPGQVLTHGGLLLCQSTYITEIRGGFAKLRDQGGWIPTSSFVYPGGGGSC